MPRDTESLGPLGAEISTAFVRLLKEHGGKGPTQCRTYFEEDVIVVLLRGGYTEMEAELFEDGGSGSTCGACGTPSRTPWRDGSQPSSSG